MTEIAIGSIKKWATDRLSVPILPTTAKQYNQVVKRLLSTKTKPGTSNNARTRSIERSAYRYIAATNILKYIASGKVELAIKTYAQIKEIDDKARENSKKYSINMSFPNAQKRNSKKLALKYLEADWREKLVSAAAASEAIYLTQIAIMATTGCRPVEMAKGVEVTRSSDGATTFKIIGAKQKIKFDKNGNDLSSGQPWRKVTFPASHAIASTIPTGTYVAKASAIEESIKHYARKVLKNGHKVTAYCYRHQLASDMKANNVGDEFIAKALGHQSVAALQGYGNVKSKCRGVTPITVSAACAVRANDRREKKYKRTPVVKTKSTLEMAHSI